MARSASQTLRPVAIINIIWWMDEGFDEGWVASTTARCLRLATRVVVARSVARMSEERAERRCCARAAQRSPSRASPAAASSVPSTVFARQPKVLQHARSRVATASCALTIQTSGFYNNFYECSTRAFHTGILKEVCARIAETARSQDRCGATESRCAFRSECTVSGSNASYCFRCIEPDGKAKGKKAAKQPPWRHALIVSTAARYPLAAAEAQSAGFLPRRIPAIYRNYSRCIPNPDYSSSQGAKLILRIKNDNLLEAWQCSTAHCGDGHRAPRPRRRRRARHVASRGAVVPRRLQPSQ